MVLVAGIGLFAFSAFQFFKHRLVAGSNTADHNSPQPQESGTAPDPVVVREELKRLVQSAGNAAVRGDADGALEHTYPAVIDAMGGMDSAKRMMATVLQQMKQSGMTFASFDIDEPKDVMEANGMSFSIIPTRATLKLPTGRLLMSS